MATSQTGKVTKIKTKTKYSSVSYIVFISTYIVTLIVVMLSIKVIAQFLLLYILSAFTSM